MPCYIPGMNILLATNNAHKVREIQQIAPLDSIITPDELGISFSLDETGDTFAANAWAKAEALRALLYSLLLQGKSKIPGGDKAAKVDAVLADDSGLCVASLDGRPGIHSARYGSDRPVPAKSDSERNRLLLHEMEGIEQRSAHYSCAVAVILDETRYILVQETLKGSIARQPSAGKGGFGYDPIFYLPAFGCTAADISSEQKHRISHRGKAVRRAMAALQSETDAVQ